MPRDFGISIEDKREIIRLIEDGHSALSISKKYCVNRTSAEQWIRTYKACGLDGVLNMGSTHKKYSYETKLAAARAFVEEGLSKAEVMARYGIVSENALKRWIRNYRQGDLEALKPKPKGRPPGAKSKPKPLTYLWALMHLSMLLTLRLMFACLRADSGLGRDSISRALYSLYWRYATFSQ